ncbi:hypothetical protein M378DRAFT_163893 [Amanita muscaria Koide BX008]|uniref:Transmembrane protein n=1 Tax=Amanita muscaria (strain Koide BX008) TaxID=946122 RepID=A0A0C2WQI7_AMAMK|nr:hypothetical protein M378DRAFT_163893 [Amanita muscaria Koide BX008]
MPNLTITIEDNSPLLSYDTNWYFGASDDNNTSLYLESNFMRVSKGGAKMTFRYTGTDVAAYGAKRGNHGRYQVAIDSTSFDPVSGAASGNGIYQALLFQSQGIKQGAHTFTITNLDDTQFLDIDFMTWNLTWGDPTAPLSISSIDDADPGWEWSGTDWSTSPSLVGRWYGATGHMTTNFGATAKMTFNGDAISLFGPVNTTGAQYSIAIDGGAPTTYDSSRTQSFQTMLFHGNNLGSGSHTLAFTCQANSLQSCGIDYAQVYSAANSTSSGSSSGSSSANPTVTVTVTASASNLSVGDIVGITLGSLAVVAALGVVAFYLTLRKGSKAYDSYEPTAFTGSQPATQGSYYQ